MDTESLISTLYAQMPLETVARHEVGHAVMAIQCGGYVKRIIVGERQRESISGTLFGRSPRTSTATFSG